MQGWDGAVSRGGVRSQAVLRGRVHRGLLSRINESPTQFSSSSLLKSSSASSTALIDDTEFQALMSPERAGLTSGSDSLHPPTPRRHCYPPPDGLIFRPLEPLPRLTAFQNTDKNLPIHDNWQFVSLLARMLKWIIYLSAHNARR